MHERKVVTLGERLQRALPRHLGLELAVVVIAERCVVDGGQIGTELTEMWVDVDDRVGAEHRPDEAVTFMIRQLDQTVVVLVHAGETRVARDGEQLPVVLVRPARDTGT